MKKIKTKNNKANDTDPYIAINKRLNHKTVGQQLVECVKMALPFVRDAEHHGAIHPVYRNAWCLQRAMQHVLVNAGVPWDSIIVELPYDDDWYELDSKIHDVAFALMEQRRGAKKSSSQAA